MRKPKKSTVEKMPELNEEIIQAMKNQLKIDDARIDVLLCLDVYDYFFPTWLKKINEGIQCVIDHKQANNIPCDEYKEVLGNIGYFFTKMAFHSSSISDWYNEKVNAYKVTKKMLKGY
jgi:Asp-tRNA(Asn)/Glu-tRNA(Gln) amidotransferase B subunit